MDRRQRIFLYGVILGLVMFWFIFQFMNAAFRISNTVEVNPSGVYTGR